jgi:hypothetical protein
LGYFAINPLIADISEEYIASIFKIEEFTEQNTGVNNNDGHSV